MDGEALLQEKRLAEQMYEKCDEQNTQLREEIQVSVAAITSELKQSLAQTQRQVRRQIADAEQRAAAESCAREQAVQSAESAAESAAAAAERAAQCVEAASVAIQAKLQAEQDTAKATAARHAAEVLAEQSLAEAKVSKVSGEAALKAAGEQVTSMRESLSVTQSGQSMPARVPDNMHVCSRPQQLHAGLSCAKACLGTRKSGGLARLAQQSCCVVLQAVAPRASCATAA